MAEDQIQSISKLQENSQAVVNTQQQSVPQVNQSSQNNNNSLAELVNVMSQVKTISPEAIYNATSIPDNNGGRIELNDPTIPQPDFKKVTG